MDTIERLINLSLRFRLTEPRVCLQTSRDNEGQP
jgi:hypothetical protein